MLRRSMTLLWSAALAAALAACDSGDGGDTDAGTLPDGASPPGTDSGAPPATDGGGPPPSGEAALAFTPTWGSAQAQFQGLNWQAILDLNIFQPSNEAFRDTRVIIMLCQSSDPTCESPVLVREVASDETDGDPIQDNFGPEIEVGGLPAGDYELMIFADTGVSRANGLAWDSGFETEEAAWGGVVSELDVMLTSEPATLGVTPPPATASVTLTDGMTTELGTVTLEHVHERDISPDPNREDGVLAVAVAEGIRLIDLNTHEVLEISEGSGFYTHQMVDGSGSPFAGTVCGMVDGPDGTVFLLYQDSSVGAGFAVQFDVSGRAQMHDGSRVVFPDEGSPCRGHYHEGHLYVTNASGSRRPVAETTAAENFWVADTAGLSAGDVTATLLDRTFDEILQNGVDDVAASGSTLYMSINGDAALGGLPSECVGSYCVFEATVGGDGVPALGAPYTYIVGPEIGESYPTTMGDVRCLEEASPWAPIQVAEFHDGRTLLFVGACLEIAVYDTSDRSELDLSAAPGTQGLDGTAFGFAFNSFGLSPDGNTLWAIPHLDSDLPFNFQMGLDESSRATANRLMAFPIDLSAGSQPGLHPDFGGEDIDGYEGVAGFRGYTTPAADPGVDLDVAYYTRHRLAIMPSTSGFQPASFPSGPTVAVTNRSLWMRGSGNPDAGASGLGKSGNLAVHDLQSRRMILFPFDDAPFYRFWHGGAEGENGWGFDLTPESPNDIATFGLRFVPAP